jgi:hypothetical protein
MPEGRERGALLVAACLIAAIRLRGEPIQPSPKLRATIYDSVQLAVLVWREIQGHGVSAGLKGSQSGRFEGGPGGRQVAPRHTAAPTA